MTELRHTRECFEHRFMFEAPEHPYRECICMDSLSDEAWIHYDGESAFLDDGPDEAAITRVALKRVADYFGDGPLIVDKGVITRPDRHATDSTDEPDEDRLDAEETAGRALYALRRDRLAQPARWEDLPESARASWRDLASNWSPCIFPGCASTDRHFHGGFPGGHRNPDDPDGPPIPFTSEPAPGVRDYNGRRLRP